MIITEIIITRAKRFNCLKQLSSGVSIQPCELHKHVIRSQLCTHEPRLSYRRKNTQPQMTSQLKSEQHMRWNSGMIHKWQRVDSDVHAMDAKLNLRPQQHPRRGRGRNEPTPIHVYCTQTDTPTRTRFDAPEVFVVHECILVVRFDVEGAPVVDLGFGIILRTGARCWEHFVARAGWRWCFKTLQDSWGLSKVCRWRKRKIEHKHRHLQTWTL